MVIGLSLSLLGLLGLSAVAKAVSDSTDAASVITDAASVVGSSDIDVVLNNSKEFAEKYQLDDVVTSGSGVPYISSPEITRPSVGGGGSRDDKKIGKSGFLGGFGTGTLLTLATSDRNFWYLLCLGLGGYVVYKVVKK